MKKVAVYIFLLFTAISRALAQEEFVVSPSRDIATIPFIQLTGGILIIQARLEDYTDTLNFILDTGSSGISLDSSTVQYLGITPTPTNRLIRGIAGIRQVDFVYNKKLHFPGITVDGLDFHVNDYTILTAVYGLQIDGIIGYSVLSRYIIKINYDSLRLTFATKGPIRYPKGGYMLNPVINPLPSISMRVKDKKAINTKFLYDMGAGLCMLFSKEFTEDSNFLNPKKKSLTKQGEGLGGKIDMELRVIRDVKIGPYRFTKVPVFVFEDPFNVTSYPVMGGLLGNDILRRFNIILNYAENDFFLLPNSHFNEPFDYSYSGLELYYIHGKIIAGDVAKGSPAEKAGILEGDEIISVNKNFSQNLNQYKIALQTPNEKVRVIVKRDDSLIEVEFKVKSIL